MKKLFNAVIKIEVVIAADSREDAAAILSLKDTLQVAATDYDVMATEFSYEPHGWNGGSIPFGADDDAQLHEFEEWQAMTEECAKHKKELADMKGKCIDWNKKT